MPAKRLFYLLSLFSLVLSFLFTSAAPSHGKDLCTGDNATIECLKNNYNKLYTEDENQFWFILIMAAKGAHQCGETSETAQFLDLVRFNTPDGEFGKFYTAQIENLCAAKPVCFLESLSRLDQEYQQNIIKRLTDPQFVDRPAIASALSMNDTPKKYRKLVELYVAESSRAN